MKLLIPIIAVAAATETVKTDVVKTNIPIQTYQQYTANAGNLLKTNTAASAASILKPAPKPFAMDPMMMMMLMGGNMGSMNPMMMMMLMGSDSSKEECIKENDLKFAFNVILADSKYTVSKVTGSKDIQTAIEGKAYALPEGAAKDLLECLEKDDDKSEDSFSKMLPFLMMMNQPKPVVTANGQTIVQKPAMDPLMMMMLMKNM